MNNFIKIFFIFFSFLISLSFGNDYSSVKILNAPISVQTEIKRLISVDETAVVQSNNSAKYFINHNKKHYDFGFLPYFTYFKNLAINLNNSFYKLKQVKIFDKFLSIYLRNEICTRAP